MKNVPIEATTGKKDTPEFKVIKGTAPEYESLKEAIAALKEEGCLKLINMQTKTNALNALRKPTADPIAQLVKKAPKEVKDQIAAILAKHGFKA
jgi:hypothetical protein